MWGSDGPRAGSHSPRTPPAVLCGNERRPMASRWELPGRRNAQFAVDNS